MDHQTINDLGISFTVFILYLGLVIGLYKALEAMGDDVAEDVAHAENTDRDHHHDAWD